MALDTSPGGFTLNLPDGVHLQALTNTISQANTATNQQLAEVVKLLKQLN